MENVIFEEICGVCHYFKFNHNEMICPPKHFSCLCELFKNKYICYKNGYSNLMKNVPYIAIYSPNPEVINSSYIQSSLNYKPSDKTILETLTFGYEQKLEVSKHQVKIEGNHPYFNYAEK